MYKPVHQLVKQVDVLVPHGAGPYLKKPPERHQYRHYSHTIRYFRTELLALVWGSFSLSLPSLILNLFWTWGWSRYRGFSEIGVPLGCLYYFHTKVCSQMTSGGDLYHVGPSKLICETN